MGSYYGYDVWDLLRFVGTVLLVVAAIVTAVLLFSWWRARRGRRTKTLALDWTLTLCAATVLLGLVAAPISVWQTMTGNEVSLEDFPFQTNLLNDHFTAESPSPGQPGVQYLSVTSGNATLVGLSSGVRALIAADQLLWVLLTLLPAVALGVICFQSLRGIPFARTVIRTLTGSGIAILVLGLAAAIFDGISRGAASAETLPPGDSGADITAGGYYVSLPLWPIGAALALIALAAVFRYGSRLQKDTEGLV